ncbi:MAG: DUF4336 domain-containing protein [Deltaproteobacteria bacterium]|nr:DUF4336 domain-containing protein [Deltaproteobacteria bacterium]
MLRSIADDLWVAEQPLRYLGVALTTRMTIVRLADGALMVHSPIHLTNELRAATARAGRVRFIVAPNRFHHLSIADWQKANPDVQTFCAPGLDTKRADLKFTGILGDNPPAAWAAEIDQAFMRAFPPLNEIVFFHRKTRTLIFTDLLFNITRHDSAYARFLLRLDGAFHGPAIPRSFMLLLRRRRVECAAFLQRLLSWDFDRAILAHGDIIENDAKAAIERAWQFAQPAM